MDIGRQVGYLIHYKRNLGNLRTEVGKLTVVKEAMSEKIAVAEAKGEKIYPNVEVWMESVAKTTKEAEELLKDKQQATAENASTSSKDDGQPNTKCVHRFCPNPMLRRRRSKNSLALVDDVTNLINEEKELTEISFALPKDLKTEVNKLTVAKETLAEKVNSVEVKGEKIHANVQDWLKRVDEVTGVAEEFLKEKHPSIDKANELSKAEIQAIENSNTSLRHGSKGLLELLQEVTELYEIGEFPEISYARPAEDDCLTFDKD